MIETCKACKGTGMVKRRKGNGRMCSVCGERELGKTNAHGICLVCSEAHKSTRLCASCGRRLDDRNKGGKCHYCRVGSNIHSR